MKKIILSLIMFVAVAASVPAQTVTSNFLSASGLTYGTVTNTGTDSVKIVCNQSYKNISLLPKVTKISGTMTSNSTPQLYGSLDGSRYTAITGDTLHITNTSTPLYTSWLLSSQQYKYYKVVWTGVGTMSAKLECLFIGIK